MRLFDRGTSVDVVLGVGLVGQAVCDAIERLPGGRVTRETTIASDWAGVAGVAQSLKTAQQWIGEAPVRARIFWCAGSGGFASTQAALRPELDAFRSVVTWSEALSERCPVELHMTSSAGGLHEGQLHADGSAMASTLRPYAQLKLSQERVLEESRLQSKYVYRPSSVYGVPRGKQRLGMIPKLVLNALRRRPTTIFALASTLRDYVSAHDVGAFVASEGKRPGVNYLVMGRPTSISSLQLAVERYLQRNVSVVYTLSKNNAAPITFSPRVMPPGWRPSTIESNLARIVSAVQGMSMGAA